VSRHPRKQMMHSLVLQTSVEPIQPSWTVDVHGGAKLALRERLCGAEIGSGHSPMRQRYLHV
jgi:hypothetical protein